MILIAAAVAGAGAALLLAGRMGGDPPHAMIELALVALTIAAAAVAWRRRTAAFTARTRSLDLARRTLHDENEVRRRLSESLHDGPVQELIGLDMMLSSAARASRDGEPGETAELLEEASQVLQRNIRGLRDEMVDLGPYAYDELTYETAVERCAPVWERRFGLRAVLEIDPLELPSEVEGALFRITQESVSNAARHGNAKVVRISLRGHDGELELAVTDDGEGFGDVDPLGPTEPGHIGLANMRERANLIGGRLAIESGEAGTKVTVRAPAGDRKTIRQAR